MIRSDYRELFEKGPHPSWLLDTETFRFLAVNDAALRVYGYTREEFAGMTIDEIRPAEDGERFRRELRATGELTDQVGESRHRRKDGTVFDVEVRSRAIEWNGRRARLVVAIDISQLKEFLAERDSFFALSQDMLAISDRNGNLLRLNAAWEGVFGYRLEEVVGRNLAEFVHEEDLGATLALAESLASGAVAGSYMVRGRRRDGAYLTLECRSTSSRGLIYTVARDVTEKLRAESHLRDLSRAVEQSPASVVITDVAGNIEYVNPKFEQVTGYTAQEVMGKNPRLLKSGKTGPEGYAQLWETILSGRTWEGEFHNRRKDGSTYMEHASISPVRDASGEIRHFVAVKEDITEKRLLERQLQHSQKMEAIGLMAGGIAHDFNNLLTVINGYCDLLQTEAGLAEEVRGPVRFIAEAVAKAAQLTKKLLLFSRSQIVEHRAVDLKQTARELAEFSRRLLPENIQIGVEMDTTPVRVMADASQLEQVIMNLVLNARDAMPQGGELRIEVRATEGQSYEAEPGTQYVCLRVSDSGIGMTEEVQQRIFEPFFTTKPPGRGTGLGLPTVYGIVKQSGGYVSVESSPGNGAAFSIYLPELAAAQEDEKVAVAAETGERGEETILLVEDVAGVRGLTKRILVAAGYSVIEAATAEEAIALAHESRGAFDLLLTDIILPGQNGIALAASLREVFPYTGALFVSGYAGEDAAVAEQVKELGDYLGKPYTAQALVAKVREALRHRKENIRVIVGDDDEDVRRFCSDALVSAGYLVETAENGREVLERSVNGPDLVVVDLVMPDGEGLETIMELRRGGARPRIVAMSGAFGGQFLRAAQVLGASATLHKPFTRNLLLRKVREVLRS